MSVPPESIEVCRCYLALGYRTGPEGYPRIRRVVEIRPDGLVLFDQRRGPVASGRSWPKRHRMELAAFANSVEREVPCDWTPETQHEQWMR